ncbi:MAG: branched-chain amino acid ABC transporter permease, partial [Acidimicrobiales bacterium]
MSNYLISALSLGAITAILVMGLNVRWGWAGQLDLAYYAFVALGAYFGAALELPPSQEPNGSGWILGLHLPFVVALIGATVLSAAVSALVGALALRKLRGEYLAIVTVSFVYIAAAILSQEKSLFNGFNGVYGLVPPLRTSLGVSPRTYSILFLVFLLLMLLLVYLLLEALYKSPFGRTLRMIREDQVVAAAFGRNVYRQQMKAYVIGGACAGFGGMLLAVWLSAFNPYAWSTTETILLYTAIFIGGQGNARGILIGTVIALVVIPQASLFLPTIPGHSDLWPAMRSGLSGILIILALRFRPQGILREPKFRDLARAEPATAEGLATAGGLAAGEGPAAPAAHRWRAPAARSGDTALPLLEVRGLAKSYG